jgi:hypothetical protein
MRSFLTVLAVAGMIVGGAQAAVTSTTAHDTSSSAFNALLSNTDLIAGQIGVELPDNGVAPGQPEPGPAAPDPHRWPRRLGCGRSAE